MYYVHEIIDSLAIPEIHKNLVPNCGMWVEALFSSVYIEVRLITLNGWN
jgi:hypothetical protein